ncbi:MAG: hypothetical protein ACE367_08360 [Acidimicrobiales bacterium]
MFKRVIWMGAGFGAGLGSSYWVKRAVNRRVERYVPTEVRKVVGSKARSAGATVKSAVDEGRITMRQYQRDAEAAIGGEGRRPERSESPSRRLRSVPD